MHCKFKSTTIITIAYVIKKDKMTNSSIIRNFIQITYNQNVVLLN